MFRICLARSSNKFKSLVAVSFVLASAMLGGGCASDGMLITKDYDQRTRMTKAEAVKFLKQYLRNERNLSVDENHLAFTYKRWVNVTFENPGGKVNTNLYREEDFQVDIPFAKISRIVKWDHGFDVVKAADGSDKVYESTRPKLYVYDNKGTDLSGGFGWGRIDDSFISALLALSPQTPSSVTAADPSEEIRQAIVQGNSAKLLSLLEGNPGLANFNTDYGTPLYIVAENGSRDMAEILIRKGAMVDGITKNMQGEFTPLFIAAKLGHKDMVGLFLAKGADVNARTDRGFTPLHIVSYHNKADVAELLIAKGAQVSAKSDLGLTPLHSAAENGGIDVAKLLVARGAEINASDKNGFMPLHKSALNGSRDFAEYLIARGATVNATSNSGFTALFCAAEKNHRDVAELLISHKADVNLKSKSGWSPLHIAVKENHNDMVNFLISNGADMNARNDEGSVPLHVAVESKNRDMVETLVLGRADLNVKNNNGWTPLRIATRGNEWVIANLLRKNGGTE